MARTFSVDQCSLKSGESFGAEAHGLGGRFWRFQADGPSMFVVIIFPE